MQQRNWGRRALIAASALVIGLTTAVPASGAPPTSLTVDEPSISTEVNPNKIDVMGLWAHPDDDAGFITPCGVWHDRYGVDCGIIMLTRGEGGSNSVGDEAGPDLGLRRENEDRASHYRSGTVDIFNIDAVDFYYNTSAALTEEVWGSERVQRQVVHVIRQTQPDILTGFSPSLAVGHGNHQYAGRVIWEAAAMAADPNVFPEQLTGTDPVDTWQVKMITSGGSTTGTGGQPAPDCNAGFIPAATNPYTVVGTWTGYDSPYTWVEGNIQGQAAGSPMTWAQVGREGFMAHATQARPKFFDLREPACQRFGIARSIVPFQPNGSEANAHDDAILFGSVIADPGGMPLGSTYTIDADNYFQAPGVPFQVTVSARSGAGTLAKGAVSLQVPAGWDVTSGVQLGPITGAADATSTFTVTPPADAALTSQKISAKFSNGSVSAYNDTRVELVAGVEGRFQRWGNFAEYEEWAADYTWVGGRSTAERQIGAGESITVPVVVTNRTTAPQSGNVSLTLPAGLVADAASKPYASLAAGEQTTVDFVVTHTIPTDPGGQRVVVKITTTAAPAGSTSEESLNLVVAPSTTIPEVATAPTLDGTADDGYGPVLDIGRKWEGADCNPNGTDCGAGSTLQMAWSGDDLYVIARVVDDKAGAAAPPERCFGHWLVDSVEVLLDPVGGSRDTSTTYKSGIMPLTDDASGAAGNGVNGPCWSRDADNHQGFSSGPLASTIKDAPNAPGQKVAVQITRNADGTYVGGGYTIETKIALADLPAAVVTGTSPTGDATTNDVDPDYLGLNVTPYDSDTTDYIGKTRLAWSPFGSQQSEPYRWGHAYLEGYTAPADRSTTPDVPIIPDTALMGVASPQTVAQSALRGVTIAGLPATRALTVDGVTIGDDAAAIKVKSTEAGTLRAYAWHGDFGMVPVWATSCVGDELGFSVCSPDDVTTAPWGDDMGGRLLASATAQVGTGTGTVTLPLTASALTSLAEDGTILLSFESASGAVNAWAYPVVEDETPPSSPPPSPSPSPSPSSSPSTPGQFVPSAPYTLPGLHNVNGRTWFTTCEPYSQTVRCRTNIWATTVVRERGSFTIKQGWVFNNLTYLPYMKRAQWATNPLGHNGSWTAADGRMWRTECDTAATGRGGCRSFAKVTVYKATAKPGGGYAFSQSDEWVFNNIVMFRPN
ncbi:PIG-L family deacetylase [Tessaracoccus antarcticus]|uniref:LmbE family protein n=1 Tax=Tessaracoccus antarcticus TaxID=2479848 RepID=A0A3M0G746_9ACTN|nr:PIG-L family deacetylase [Tessaracoccus antarcticus]RMB58182.1 LmbE family protein [Tessaracoccus antarcticus]